MLPSVSLYNMSPMRFAESQLLKSSLLTSRVYTDGKMNSGTKTQTQTLQFGMQTSQLLG